MNGLVIAESRVPDVSKPLPETAIRLRERMEETGMTQQDLAIAIGATQGAVSQILTGSSRKSRLLPHIAEKLAVNLNWLLGITDEKIDMFDVDGRDVSEDQLAGMKAGITENRLQAPNQLTPNRKANEPRQDESSAEQRGAPTIVQLGVVLPNEAALVAMFETLLALIPADASRAEAAQILAQRLPSGFAAIGSASPGPHSAARTAGAAAPRSPAKDRRGPARP